MKFGVIAIAGLIFMATVAQAAPSDQQTFGAWKVEIRIDDFEGKVKPTLTADVLSNNGKRIGKMSIGHFIFINGEFYSALVSFRINGLKATFPDCDYEFLKYKIDSDQSQYFPTRGHACPSLEIKNGIANEFSSGETFKFSASGKTGVVSLKGFKEAWAYAQSKLKK